ncbi:MAG: universal stress protein [Acidobacteriota bacterium]
MQHVERILVPLDHSAGTDAIVDFASVIARGMGSKITLLHVYDPPNEMVGLVPGATVTGELAAEQDAGVALLDRAEARVRGAGIAVDRLVERAAPASAAIVHHAALGSYDLVVMGTHGRHGIERLLLGSTAEHVMRDAPCPVVAVHLPRD